MNTVFLKQVMQFPTTDAWHLFSFIDNFFYDNLLLYGLINISCSLLIKRLAGIAKQPAKAAKSCL
jgi:hypothetical protein